MARPRNFAGASEYLSAYPPDGDGLVPTPVVDPATGRWRSLNAVLYGAPPPEGMRSKVRRMADIITRRVCAAGNVTRDELLAGGFDEIEITTLYRKALKRAGVHRLGADL